MSFSSDRAGWRVSVKHLNHYSRTDQILLDALRPLQGLVHAVELGPMTAGQEMQRGAVERALVGFNLIGAP